MRNMTPRQWTAIRHTARLAEETAHPRFFRGHGWASTILSFNSGFE